MASTAFALVPDGCVDNTPTTGQMTCTATGGGPFPVTLPNCPGQTLLHFIVTPQLEPSPEAFFPFTVVAHFNTGDAPGVHWKTQSQSVDQAEVFIPPPAGATQLISATTVLPNTFSFGNFNLSGAPTCVTTTTTTTTTSTTTSPTPELDSFVLFGAGVLGMAGYALYKRRRSRPTS